MNSQTVVHVEKIYDWHLTNYLFTKQIEQVPGGISLAGKVTNVLLHSNVPSGWPCKKMDVCRDCVGGCGQGSHDNGLSKLS